MFAIMFPNIDPVLVSAGPVQIYWYGVAYVAAIIMGWRYGKLLIRRSPNSQITEKNFDDFIIWLAVGIIIGGRIGYLIFYNPGQIIKNPLELFHIWVPGRSFHGGLIGAVISTLWFCHRNKINLWRLSDIAAMATPIGLFFGRIANFVNAELYGRTTEVSWGIIFPGSDGLPRHPSQLYEAFAEGILLFILLLLVEFKTDWREKKPGSSVGLMLLGYGVARTICELFREPDAPLGYFFGNLTMGQLLSFPMLLAGCLMFIYGFRRKES